MIIPLYIIVVVLAVVLCVTLFNAITAPMLKNAPAPRSMPRVSLLIPARNEETNIGMCLEGLRQQDYSELEIIVLNDGSTDKTAEIVQRVAVNDRRIKLVEGLPLPVGWTGKNWACHQLNTKATGEIFIFTDADNRYAPQLVTHTVGWMQHLGLGLLSAFPQQVTHTFPEKLVVPIFDMFVYSYLPLWFTYYFRAPSISAANGQWLAFTRQAYERIGGHHAVRHHVVEDVALARRAKQMGEKILTLPGTGEVFGRMYNSWQQVWEGFSKNAFGLVDFKAVPFFFILMMLFLIHVLPYFLVWFKPFVMLAAIAIMMNVYLRLVLAVKYAQPLFVGTVLHPVAIIFTLLIGVNSYRWYKHGTIKWKGRKIEI